MPLLYIYINSILWITIKKKEFIMNKIKKISLESELKYFDKKCEEIGNSDYCNEIRYYLYKLLEFNTTKEIVSFYNDTKENTEIILDCFETVCVNSDDVDTVKVKVTACIIDKLLKERVVPHTIL